MSEAGIKEAEAGGNALADAGYSFDLAHTSLFTRAHTTLNKVLDAINQTDLPVHKTWRLNERHYGGLTGLNKDETIKKYGDKQVKIWRRSFDTPPPEMELNHPYKNKISSSISSESLKDTFDRVMPYFNKKIKPLLQSNKNILIVFHGNSCRALLMNILNISKEKIIELEVPTANPLLIKFENELKVINYEYLDKKRAKKILFNI